MESFHCQKCQVCQKSYQWWELTLSVCSECLIKQFLADLSSDNHSIFEFVRGYSVICVYDGYPIRNKLYTIAYPLVRSIYDPQTDDVAKFQRPIAIDRPRMYDEQLMEDNRKVHVFYSTDDDFWIRCHPIYSQFSHNSLISVSVINTQ